MEVVNFYKCTEKEFENIRILLEETEIFTDNYIGLIEKAMLRGLQIELPEEHALKLEELGLVRIGNRKINTNLNFGENNKEEAYSSLSEESNEIAASSEETEYSPKDNISEDEELSEGIEEAGEAESLNEDSEEVEENDRTTSEKDGDNEEPNLEEEKAQKEFIPQSFEDLKDIPEEEVAKRYYLTPERIIESMKRIDNGMAWSRIHKACGGNFNLETAITRAYATGFYQSDLSNPNFLDDRIKQFLPEGEEAIEFKGLHMAAVLGTYVGYHVEKTQGDIDEVALNGTPKTNLTVVKFPMVVSEMPEELKETVRDDLTNSLTKRIEEIFRNNSGQRALILLRPVDGKIDELSEEYSNSLQDTAENKAVKAYIQVIRNDMHDEMKNDFDELNVSMDLYGVNWKNKDERKRIISSIDDLHGDSKNFDISRLVEEINLSFVVNSNTSPEEIRALCEDLSLLAKQGIDVNIAFELSTKDMLSIQKNREINAIINEYNNIHRDTGTELINNGTDLIINGAISASLGNAMSELGENITPDNLSSIHGIPVLGSPERILRDILMGATDIDSSVDREDPEINRRPLF